jgi:LAGLIDADG endonuclease/LAGLIDADG-like domain
MNNFNLNNWSLSEQIAYLHGILDTDGHFDFIIKKSKRMYKDNQVVPEISISQSSKNPAIINIVRGLLDSLGIAYEYKPNKTVCNNSKYNSQNLARGDKLLVTGINNVRKLLYLLLKSPVGLTGSKRHDLLIFKLFFERLVDQNLHNTANGRAQIIDLKYNLHGNEYGTPDYICSPSSLTREVWEARHEMPVGSTIGACKDFLKEKWRLYNEWHNELSISINSSDFFSKHQLEWKRYAQGVVDGDGSFSVSISFCAGKPRVSPAFKIACDHLSSFTLTVIKAYFKTLSIDGIITKSTTTRSYVFVVGKQQSVKNVVSFFLEYPLLGNRQKQVLMIRDVINTLVIKTPPRLCIG